MDLGLQYQSFDVVSVYQLCKISIATLKLPSVTVIKVNIFEASPFTADFRYCNLKLFVN